MLSETLGIKFVIASGIPPSVCPPGIQWLFAPASFPHGGRRFKSFKFSISILTKPPPLEKCPESNPKAFS